MEIILFYLHMAVIFFVGALFCNFDSKWLKTFGVLNVAFATAYAYGYAIYSLWKVLIR